MSAASLDGTPEEAVVARADRHGPGLGRGRTTALARRSTRSSDEPRPTGRPAPSRCRPRSPTGSPPRSPTPARPVSPTDPRASSPTQPATPAHRRTRRRTTGARPRPGARHPRRPRRRWSRLAGAGGGRRRAWSRSPASDSAGSAPPTRRAGDAPPDGAARRLRCPAAAGHSRAGTARRHRHRLRLRHPGECADRPSARRAGGTYGTDAERRHARSEPTRRRARSAPRRTRTDPGHRRPRPGWPTRARSPPASTRSPWPTASARSRSAWSTSPHSRARPRSSSPSPTAPAPAGPGSAVPNCGLPASGPDTRYRAQVG